MEWKLRLLNSGEFNIPRTTLRDKLSGKTTEKIETVGSESFLGVEIENKLV